MKAGIIGFNGSGRDSCFSALTSLPKAMIGSVEPRLGEALVSDERLDKLAVFYKPQKHTLARVEFFLAKPQGDQKDALKLSLEKVRECEVLLMVLRNFKNMDGDPDPLRDADLLEAELIVNDYLIVEKRLERLNEEKKRGKKNDPEELELLLSAKELLEANQPLRIDPKYAASPKIKGFGLLSAKPLLALVNNDDDDASEFVFSDNRPVVTLRGRLEAELGQMTAEEAQEFAIDYGFTESAAARVINKVYELMGLISFFTIGVEECRAWTIKKGDSAYEAAAVIHSDIQKGFIRAEVVAYQDFIDCGGFAEAKKRGVFRLEGKNYIIQDGDITHFRFNV